MTYNFQPGEADLLKWAVEFIWATGLHNPAVSTNAINFTDLVKRMTTTPALAPVPEAKKE